MLKRVFQTLLAAALAASAVQPSVAQPAAGLDGLAGQTIRFIIGGTPNGTTDQYARPFVNGLKALLPDTTILVQNVQGGGGMVALAEAETARQGAITLVVTQNAAIANQMIGAEVMPVDLTRFHPIGSFTHEQRILAVRSSLGVTTLDQLTALGRGLVTPVFSETSPGNIEALAIIALTDIDLDIVLGADEALTATLLLAGDADIALNSYVNLRQQIDAGVVLPLLRIGADGYPSPLADTPGLAEIVPAGTAPEVLEILDSVSRLGRLLFAVPATEPATVEALRIAFDRIMASPELAAAYLRQDLVLVPTGGAEVERRLYTLLADPAAAGIFRAHIDCGRREPAGQVAACRVE